MDPPGLAIARVVNHLSFSGFLKNWSHISVNASGNKETLFLWTDHRDVPNSHCI